MNKNVRAIMKRELYGYFHTPVAYVFIIIFLFLTGIFSFYLGAFLRARPGGSRAFFPVSSMALPVPDTGYCHAALVRREENRDD